MGALQIQIDDSDVGDADVTSRDAPEDSLVVPACAENRRERLISLTAAAKSTPGSRRFRTMCRTAYKRHGKSFLYQDRPNVPTVGFERSAISSIIACERSLRPRRARAGDIYEVQIARPHQFTESPRCFGSKLALRLTRCSACLWRIKPDQADIRLLVIDADRIPIDDTNVGGID
jgi:hypothetical protein